MKKIVLILFVLFFIALAGITVFFFTLNVDQYRPQIENQLHVLLGKPVRLEKISMGWRGGLELSLRGLLVANDEDFQKEFIRLESAYAELNLAPLLTHEVQISSVYLEHPVIRLIKKRDGEFEGFEKKETAAEVRSGGKGDPRGKSHAAEALVFMVSDIRVDAGELFYRDESGAEPVEITIRDLDLKIKNVTLNQPIDIEAKAALFSSHQNAKITGNLRISSEKGSQVLRNVHGELDLNSVNIQEFAKLVPSAASPSGLSELAGNLIFDIDTLKLNAKGMKELAADLRLTNGKVKMATLKAPIENIAVNMLAASDKLQLQSLVADFAGGKFQGSGVMNLKIPKPLTSFEIGVKNLSLENVLEPALDPQAPLMKGMVSGTFQGTLSGLSGPAFTHGLGGEGQLTLENGRVMNLNILREVFQKLSMIPGLVDNLRRRLPEDYQEKLNARNTILDTVRLPFTAKDGVLIFNQISAHTDSFAIQGGGSYGLDSKTLGAQANLFVDPILSEALIKSVHELQTLADRSGALMIPLNIQGRLPDISVTPDLQYIASRLAMAKTQDILSSLLKKPQEQTSESATAGQPILNQTSGSQGSSTEEPVKKTKFPKGSQILGELLQNVLQPESGDSGSSGNPSSSQRSNKSLF